MTTTVPPAPTLTSPVASARLVPALVNGQRIFIECPDDWCTEDHIAENEQRIEDISHGGPIADLMLPLADGSVELLAFARLAAAPYGDSDWRKPSVTVEAADAPGMHMRPEMVEQFADNLEAFAAQLRTMARTAAAEAVA